MEPGRAGAWDTKAGCFMPLKPMVDRKYNDGRLQMYVDHSEKQLAFSFLYLHFVFIYILW